MSGSAKPRDAIGWIAIALTVALWVTFALSTRAIAFSHLTRLDVAFIRYAVPSVVLLPWMGKAWRAMRRAPFWTLSLIAIGAGLPFLMLSALGASRSSATLLGVINPGIPPVYVAMLGFLIWRQPVSRIAIAGYVCIVLGVVTMVLASPSHLGITAAGILLLSAFFWALFTIGYQRSGLHPATATVLVNVPSAMVALALIATGVGPSNLTTAPLSQIGEFVLMQGIGSGIVSSLAYTVAIRRLGARTAATFGALSPGVTAMVAIPVFGESVTAIAACGIALVVGGIVLANRQREPHAAPTSETSLVSAA
ncbi:MAG: DMT family transporter [Thermomicrobiales bacterium]